jgi:hypothetical protein
MYLRDHWKLVRKTVKKGGRREAIPKNAHRCPHESLTTAHVLRDDVEQLKD